MRLAVLSLWLLPPLLLCAACSADEDRWPQGPPEERALVRATLRAAWEGPAGAPLSPEALSRFERLRPELAPSFKLWGRSGRGDRIAYRVWYANGATIEATFAVESGTARMTDIRRRRFAHP